MNEQDGSGKRKDLGCQRSADNIRPSKRSASKFPFGYRSVSRVYNHQRRAAVLLFPMEH